MTFNDIFKSSFLEKVSSISVFDMILTILLSFGVGLFIFLVYKKTYRGVMYSAGFGTTLIALTMITATVILAVTSNVVLSLGMVGALSIVRFRTAIKDPLDIAFLFWAIGTGKTATTEQAQEVCAAIRACIAEIYDDATAAAIRIQYGGSVNGKTAPELFAQPDIDGGLVGGASLKADFGQIVNYNK